MVSAPTERAASTARPTRRRRGGRYPDPAQDFIVTPQKSRSHEGSLLARIPLTLAALVSSAVSPHAFAWYGARRERIS